jgi:hypothetical protein
MMVDLRTSVSRFAPDSSKVLHEMRLSAPVGRSSRGYIQSTAASVRYQSSSWTPAWRYN